ncbi:MAG: hypothetical protein HGGPFJEG_00930 [Ignavibacteria bacterium]|nr:hypothetical protein [Ignavibacteria bacterium]
MIVLKEHLYNITFLAVVFISLFFFMGVEVVQDMHIKGNGAGSMKLTYFVSESVAQKNSNLIGNFPFDDARVKEYFTAPGVTLKKSQIIKKDGNIYVVADIDFTTVYKIKDLKGFQGTNSSFLKTDSGMVFYWNLKGNDPKQSGVLDKISYSFSFDGDIKSTTGLIKDKKVIYYRDTKSGSFNSDLFCSVTVTPSEVKSTGSETNQEKTENKSCGLFGIELPLILVGGYFFTRKLRK